MSELLRVDQTNLIYEVNYECFFFFLRVIMFLLNLV